MPAPTWLSGVISGFAQINDVDAVAEEVLRRRSIYLPVSRTNRPFKGSEPLRQFDFPTPNEITGARQASTVPTQSLFMMNSPFVLTQATKLAERLLAENAQSEADRMNRLYLATYGRPGKLDEIQDGVKYLEMSVAGSDGESAADARGTAWTELCHAVLISTEFLTHD